jgi:signal transduction histidine kinase
MYWECMVVNLGGCLEKRVWCPAVRLPSFPGSVRRVACGDGPFRSAFDCVVRRDGAASACVDHETRAPLRRLQERLKELLLGVPVFVKVMGIALGMAVVLGGGMLWQIHRTWHAHMLRDLDERGRKLGNEVSARCANMAGAGQTAEVAGELRHSVAEAPDLAYLVLQDSKGVVVAEARDPGAVPGAREIRELTAVFGKDGYQLRVGMSRARLDEEVGWLTRRLARTTGVILLLGLLAAWWLARIFAQPIEELVTLARAVRAGSYEMKAPVRAQDEVGELATAFNEMTGAIAQKEAARQQLLRKVIHAGEEERKRIARELHDDTGQGLTSQIAALSALEKQCPTEEMCQRLAEVRRQTEQTLEGVHALAVALRPSVLDDVGLKAALERHCRLFGQRFGIEVGCVDLGLNDRRLPAEVELTVYRVVQEALGNAVRHGEAMRVQVLVRLSETGLLAIVRDNGRGFDARDWQQHCLEGNHLGLLGIEERLSLIGGSFCVDSEPGKGAAVYADVPLGKET